MGLPYNTLMGINNLSDAIKTKWEVLIDSSFLEKQDKEHLKKLNKNRLQELLTG